MQQSKSSNNLDAPLQMRQGGGELNNSNHHKCKYGD